ncbi:MAG: hypothetical protein OXE17_09355 [Chloroflexi bacterium]|nr:hypothetical protein [Chloroflexota bacterium]
MVTRINNDLQERLRKAEEAENAVNRLGGLAAEAPVLRHELARAQRQQGWDRARKNAMEECNRKMETVYEKQARVPQLLEEVSTMVSSLYQLFKEIDSQRREALEQMAIVDRVDYEAELTDMEAEQEAMGRDPGSVEYLVASRHGYARVKKMMDETFPNFSYLKDCDMEDPMRRDVAQFILAHVVPIEEISVVHNAEI